MNKLILAAAAAATVFGAGSAAFAPEAEAGMRIGFGFRPHFFRPHYYSPPPRAYRAPDEDEVRVKRRSLARSKPKPEKAVPLVKFADGSGRQFDPASKVWFDGKSQCFSGQEQFTFKNNAWFYGDAKWIESNGIWKTSSAGAPELVSCQSVPSFAAKAAAFSRTAKQEESSKGAAEQPKTPPATVPKVKTAEGTTSEPAKAAPAPTECKKYFPSIGQMLLVPCGE